MSREGVREHSGTVGGRCHGAIYIFGQLFNHFTQTIGAPRSSVKEWFERAKEVQLYQNGEGAFIEREWEQRTYARTLVLSCGVPVMRALKAVTCKKREDRI